MKRALLPALVSWALLSWDCGGPTGPSGGPNIGYASDWYLDLADTYTGEMEWQIDGELRRTFPAEFRVEYVGVPSEPPVQVRIAATLIVDEQAFAAPPFAGMLTGGTDLYENRVKPPEGYLRTTGAPPLNDSSCGAWQTPERFGPYAEFLFTCSPECRVTDLRYVEHEQTEFCGRWILSDLVMPRRGS